MEISFDDFAAFIRNWLRVPLRIEIRRETQFERDLGVTGDDGGDLLAETERRYGVALSSEQDGYRKTFDLAPNEYLSNSEGFGVVAGLITLFTAPEVRPFTVGELYDAVSQTSPEEKSPRVNE